MNLKKPKPFYLHEEDKNINEINKLLFDYIYGRLSLHQDPWVVWPEPKTGDIINWYETSTGDDIHINNTTTTTASGGTHFQ